MIATTFKEAMNDENSQNTEGPSRKSFLGRLSQLFQGEPKDRQELVDVFRDSEENEVIDHDTRDMLEGVMEISEMRCKLPAKAAVYSCPFLTS